MKKITLKLMLVLVFIILAAIALIACDNEQNRALGLEIVDSPYRTAYAAGENFDATGGLVRIKNSVYQDELVSMNDSRLHISQTLLENAGRISVRITLLIDPMVFAEFYIDVFEYPYKSLSIAVPGKMVYEIYGIFNEYNFRIGSGVPQFSIEEFEIDILNHNGDINRLPLSDERFKVSSYYFLDDSEKDIFAPIEGLKIILVELIGTKVYFEFAVYVVDISTMISLAVSNYNLILNLLNPQHTQIDATHSALWLRDLSRRIDTHLDRDNFNGFYELADIIEYRIKEDGLITRADETLSIYEVFSKYLIPFYYRQDYHGIDYWLRTTDLREFFDFYLDSVQNSLDGGDMMSIGGALWARFLELNFHERFWFFHIIDSINFEFVFFSVQNDLIHYNRFIFTQTNAFANLMATYSILPLFLFQTPAARYAFFRILLIIELHTALVYWLDNYEKMLEREDLFRLSTSAWLVLYSDSLSYINARLAAMDIAARNAFMGGIFGTQINFLTAEYARLLAIRQDLFL